MQTIFDKTTRDELIQRINALNDNSQSLWGKMNIYQMMKHCNIWEEMMLGRRQYRRVLLGKLFGKWALKDTLKDKPMAKNVPTIKDMKITGNGNVAAEKAKWIALIQEHAHATPACIDHPFFGKITHEQIGYIVYKHTDHHLRQFNA